MSQLRTFRTSESGSDKRESSTNGTPTAFLYTSDNQPGRNDLIYSRKESYRVTRNKFMTEEI